MAEFKSFAEDAGMKKIADQSPAKEALKIVKTLKNMGINPKLLGSADYILVSVILV